MARFLIAHRLASRPQEPERSRAPLRDFKLKVMAFADEVEPAHDEELDESKVMIVEGDAREFEAKRKETSPEVIIETEKLRRPGYFHPLVAVSRQSDELPAGIGAVVELNVAAGDGPLQDALAVLNLVAYRGPFTTTVFGHTDRKGRASLPFNPRTWMPAGLTVVPRSGAWAGFAPVFGRRVFMSLPALQRQGPLGWWHRALGINDYSESLGEGIRVGVIDTGVGPHPYLSHVESAGAFLGGQHLTGEGVGNDVAEHGTHVSGIIGARPSSGSRDFAGLAPGAEMVMARVYPGGGPPTAESGASTNGDIAQAILTLSRDERCDIINLSSGGPVRSPLEADRINAALSRGTLVICSVGNGSGPPVLFPAAEPAAIGVSAIGVPGCAPFGVLDTLNYFAPPDHFSAAGFFSPNFNSVGPEVKCTGPGVAIISTVPTCGPYRAPYVAMSGSSMAAPAITGALAASLSRDEVYKSLPRNRERSLRAWAVLARTFRSLGLLQQYQGYGIPAAMSDLTQR